MKIRKRLGWRVAAPEAMVRPLPLSRFGMGPSLTTKLHPILLVAAGLSVLTPLAAEAQNHPAPSAEAAWEAAAEALAIRQLLVDEAERLEKSFVRHRFPTVNLTDDELALLEGKRDVLVGKLQEKYGLSKEKAIEQIKELEDAL